MRTLSNPHPPGTDEHEIWDDEHPPCDQCQQPVDQGFVRSRTLDEAHVFCDEECRHIFCEHEREAEDRRRDDQNAIGRGIRSST